MELISKRTRREFQEYFVSTTLREIEHHFDNYDVPHTTLPPEKLHSGQRRSLVEEYYASINWADPKDIKKILFVYTDVLLDLTRKNDIWENGEFRKNWTKKLIDTLKRDNYEFNGTSIVPIGQIEFELLEWKNR